MAKLTNKIAVVTGASKGIGAGIAKALAAEGATVVVNYASSRDDADRVVRDIEAAGGKAVAIGANVAVEAEVNSLFAQVKKQFGRVDVLVNNAGVYSFAPLEDVTEAMYRKMFDVNVLGPIFTTKAASPLFPDTGGSIINISSVASTLAPPNASTYVSTKGAVDAFTKSIAKEFAPRKIRVNAINPGFIHTEGTVSGGMAGSDVESMLVAMTPLARAGQPDDIALPAVFLASDDARFITGETLYVAGGAGM